MNFTIFVINILSGSKLTEKDLVDYCLQKVLTNNSATIEVFLNKMPNNIKTYGVVK